MNQRYYEQLNGMRAIAVLAVVATHTVDIVHHPWLVWGEEGVTLFFVISGFLITGILLDARDEAASADVGRRSVLRAFYARRFLRIFPVYYLTIAVAAIVGFEGVRDGFWWYVSYLANWHIAFDAQWNVATHAWSLAVEEQFYLLWPLVLLAVPRRTIPWVITLMVAIGPMSRAVLIAGTDLWRPGVDIVTPAALDSLGLGAALAWAWRRPTGPERFVRWSVGAGAAILVLDRILVLAVGGPDAAIGATRIWVPLLFVGVVHAVSLGVPGPLGRALRSSPMSHVGLVSYGVYLFHPFIEQAFHTAAERVGFPLPDHGVFLFALIGAVSIWVATISWNFFESPINRRKARFPYVPRPNRGGEAAVAPSSA